MSEHFFEVGDYRIYHWLDPITNVTTFDLERQSLLAQAKKRGLVLDIDNNLRSGTTSIKVIGNTEAWR
jgi:hypothetical protein